MKSLYGTDIDRRTVYSAISLLKDNLGYEISTYEENKQGYIYKNAYWKYLK